MKRIYLLGITVLLLGQIALADSTFVSGAVRGNWTREGSPYIIESYLIIETGDTLSIGPGVRVYFTGPYFLQMDSAASLSAIGAEGDSVVFTGRTDVDSLRWAGIDCTTYTVNTLRLEYCVVENATGHESNSAVTCHYNNLVIEHSTFRRNIGRAGRDVHGGALRVGDYSYDDRIVRISDCVFEDNVGYHGGAAAFHSTGGTIERCFFINNIGQSGGALYSMVGPLIIRDCVFSDNHASDDRLWARGGAIWFESSGGQVQNCRFERNYAQTFGGAIADSWGGNGPNGGKYEGNLFINNTCDSTGGAMAIAGPGTIKKCIFESNNAEHGGAIANVDTDELKIANCTIVGNHATIMGSALELYSGAYGHTRFTNNIVAYNTGAPAVRAPVCTGNFWRNNAFWGNDTLFRIDQCSSRHGVQYVNVNGDSCDADYNIYLDPQFTDWEAGDFTLSANSPLIDAGIAGAIFSTVNDPDNTPPDIGAFYFDQTSASEELPELPSEISLSQNYPNPFNAETTIEFEVPMETRTTLELFDITGRHVRTLFDDVANGRNSVHVSTSGLASGIYIYRLNASGYALSHKMLLIK